MKTEVLLYPLLLSILMTACKPNQNQGQQEEVQEFPTLLLEARKTALSVEYPATLQGEQTVEIRSKVDGYIEQVYVNEGAQVRKGQPLFKIDANSYQQEVNSRQAAVIAAEANLETATIQSQRTKVLVDRKIVNSFELTSAKNVERVKRAELNQAKADLSSARSKLAYTHIVSPIAGVVGSLPYKIGSLVSSTSASALTTVANTRQIYAYFSLSQQQLASFLRKYDGQRVNDKFRNMPEVSLTLADGTRYPVKGKIETLSGVLNANTGAANFKAVFPNPESKLWSGASAVLSIPTTINEAILVPKSSTFELQGKHFVFSVDATNTVHNTAVEVMDAVTEKDYVVISGVKSGDKIVTEGLGNLKDGMKIKATPSSSK
ncbi:efflux RND transporter periplasmic adaptor subunit [Pedobacter steynii]|uniref:Uncharacterized protein n=1 Tax=Pedobacter steynii TaxID=430522 RepID=A0A1D7QM47_9SPHI|nr:efflux RND transporter periplasmic adaptor subunit [Pedobacter steynii]AOM79751.1 hypothetical protein BFS30_22860 [Pedobacter steynii]